MITVLYKLPVWRRNGESVKVTFSQKLHMNPSCKRHYELADASISGALVEYLPTE